MTPTKPRRATKAVKRYPWQPVIIAPDGVKRFRANAICKWLCDTGRANLNEIALQNFSKEDQAQFAQLIGYSTSGWGDLSYVPRDDAEAAERKRVAPLSGKGRRK